MKMFGRTGGYYLFWTGFAYLTGGISLALSDFKEYVVYAQFLWFVALCAPFAVPALGRWLNMEITWDRKMMDWFKSREEREKDYKVVEFPKPVEVPTPAPLKAVPTKPESQEHYRVGYDTGSEMVTLTLLSNNYSSMTLSMSNAEVDHLVRMLKAAQRFEDDEGTESE